MPQALAQHKSYQADFERLERGLRFGDAPWLQALRRQAMDSFDQLGFPTALRGNEKWKYTRVAPIAEAAFEHPFDGQPDRVQASDIQGIAPWDKGWTNLVFVDGRYSAALSTPNGAGSSMQAISLAAALATEEALVQQHLARYADFKDDAFIALNTAFLEDGALVWVPPGETLPTPLHILFITTEHQKPVVTYPRVLLVAGSNSRLILIESYISLSSNGYFTNSVVEMLAEEGAQIEHYRFARESPRAYHVGMTRAYLAKDSVLKTTSLTVGCAILRNDLMVLLDAPGASTEVRGLHLTNGVDHVDNHIDIDHAKPYTKSNQYFKGVLDGKSRAVFSGRVLIRQNAVKAQAHQKDYNIILSEGAEIDTKPALEIYCDDVMATHGATAGHVAEELLFYMRSRGLDRELARALLVRGFASEIIDGVGVDSLRSYLDRQLSQALPTHQPERSL
ncbi:MAG: Fe-S cluster assembly protein SufD [Chloroflexi bacterium]|nr:Fe-S cluster assembly protein SufD [Chloroflexota bacterium]